jgi:hypothetical protein
MKRDKRYWKICVTVVVILVVLGYTPLMIPRDVYKPMFLGIPYSLWTSILVTIALVALTYLGSRVHPGTDKEGTES